MANRLRNLAVRARLIHRAWRYRLRAERSEVLFMLRHLKPGQTAIDIGAHKGAFTYWMNSKVGPAGRVVAFEPIPQLAEYLRQIKAIFPFPQLEVVEAALSDAPGERDFYIRGTGCLGMSGFVPRGAREDHLVVPVKTNTLDQFCRDRSLRPLHFIKCDVEGHELEVFRGAEQVLREDRPILLFECEDPRNGGGQTERVLPYLIGLGYEGVFFHRGRVRPLGEFSVNRHQGADHADWCPNFGFLPASQATTAAA